MNSEIRRQGEGIGMNLTQSDTSTDISISLIITHAAVHTGGGSSMYVVLVFSAFNSKGKVFGKNVVGIVERAYTRDSDPSVDAGSSFGAPY